MDQNRYFLDGPGEVLVQALDASGNPSYVLAVSSCKTASLKTSITQEKVTGGRSLFARRKYTTEKSGTFDMEDCETDFRYYALSQGEEVVDVDTLGAAAPLVYAFGDDQKYQVPATAPYEIQLRVPGLAAAGLQINQASMILQRDTGELITIVATTPGVAEGKFDPATNKIAFDATNAGKSYKIMFKHAAPAHTKIASTKGDSLPRTVNIVHRMPAYDNNNVIIGYQEIEIFKAQLGGDFEEAYAEKAAFAPKLSFEIIESGRADNKLVDHRFIPATTASSVTVAVTGVMLNKANTTLAIGASETLVATIAPYAATNKAVVWSTSDAAKVTVTATGTIQAKAAGSASITVTTADGNKTASCTVTVS